MENFNIYLTKVFIDDEEKQGIFIDLPFDMYEGIKEYCEKTNIDLAQLTEQLMILVRETGSTTIN